VAKKTIEKSSNLSGETQQVLKSVFERYQKLGSWRAKFTQDSYSPSLGKGNFNEGTFYFAAASDAKTEKFRYSLEGPEFSDFISNGKEAWLANYRSGRKKAAEVKHFSQIKNIDLNRYLIFFRGFDKKENDFKNLTQNFNIDGKVEGNLVRLMLEPRGESDVAKIELVFENAVEAPKSAIITDQLGNSTTIKITSFENINVVDEKMFIANFPKGSRIEEL
jgi:outer membrane lipoprotein-sorting protein